MKVSGIKINGLTADSRLVKDGYLFAALDSEKALGSSYIPLAIENGATVILGKKEYEVFAKGVTFVADDNPNKKFAELASEFYGDHPKHIAGITGTNGKTSIADFVRQILTAMGEKAASIGTLGLVKGNELPIPSPNTTPNAVVVAQELAELKKDNYDFVYIHVEAPDEMGHQGLVKEKVQAIENIDKYIVEPLVEQMDASGEEYRILILPDHPTPIRIRTHSNGPIPYLLYDSTKQLGSNAAYNETAGNISGIVRKDGYQLIDVLFNS